MLKWKKFMRMLKIVVKRMEVIIKLSELFVTVLKSFTYNLFLWELIGTVPYMYIHTHKKIIVFLTLWKIVISFISLSRWLFNMLDGWLDRSEFMLIALVLFWFLLFYLLEVWEILLGTWKNILWKSASGQIIYIFVPINQ